MTRRAAKIDNTQTAIVDALRQAGCLVLSLAPLGRGAPDLLVWRGNKYGPGVWGLLECKTGKGKLTPQQEGFHSLWPVHVVRTPGEALRAMLLNNGDNSA